MPLLLTVIAGQCLFRTAPLSLLRLDLLMSSIALTTCTASIPLAFSTEYSITCYFRIVVEASLMGSNCRNKLSGLVRLDDCRREITLFAPSSRQPIEQVKRVLTCFHNLFRFPQVLDYPLNFRRFLVSLPSAFNLLLKRERQK